MAKLGENGANGRNLEKTELMGRVRRKGAFGQNSEKTVFIGRPMAEFG